MRKKARKQAASRGVSTKRTHRRKKKRAPLFYFFIILFSISLIVIWFIFTFFKVKSVMIEGDKLYDKSQIISLSGISLGENILNIDKKKIEKKIEKEFAMIESVKVTHKLFGTIVIDITQAKPMVVSKRSDQTYLILSDKLKILKMGVDIIPPDVAVLDGITLIEPEEGEYAVFSTEDEIKEEALKEILLYMAKYDLVKINKIDISNYLDIKMEYDSRIGIKVGTRSRMDTKMKDLKFLVDERIDMVSYAIVDLSLLESQTKPNFRFIIVGSLDEFYENETNNDQLENNDNDIEDSDININDENKKEKSDNNKD